MFSKFNEDHIHAKLTESPFMCTSRREHAWVDSDCRVFSCLVSHVSCTCVRAPGIWLAAFMKSSMEMVVFGFTI